MIGANQDTIFRRLCDAMQQPELASDKRFINHVSRGDNQETLDQLINDWCSLRDVDAVEELMELHAVPAGKVYRAPDMLNDPHFIDREAIVNVPSERWTDLKMQNVFPKMSKTQGQIRWSGVEELGAHNDEIYEGMLNLTKDQLIDLKKKSII